MEDKIYTMEEAAKYLRIHAATLRLKAKNNEINYFKIGTVFRFTESDINKYIEAHRK
jgi:excisionase family DNA binding protein